MQAYVNNLYQIIWATKFRAPVLRKQDRSRLFGYLWGVLKEKKCVPFEINGVEDHLHIATHLHQDVALSGLVKDLKLAAHELIKSEELFPEFTHWQRGYSAFSYHTDQKDALCGYIRKQEAHHAKHPDSRAELIQLLKIHGVAFEDKYLD